MVEYKKGYFATSLAGHDKGRLYIIIEETAKQDGKDYVLLADGEIKTLDKPKKKKVKHIQVIHCMDKKIEELIVSEKPIRDEDIKCAIKAYYREHRRI